MSVHVVLGGLIEAIGLRVVLRFGLVAFVQADAIYVILPTADTLIVPISVVLSLVLLIEDLK